MTFANIMYIMRKQLTPHKIEEVYRNLEIIFEFVEFSRADIAKAVAMAWDDFEDAVQSATAERIHADYIVTRNVRDFLKSNILAFTPTELIARV